MSDRLTYLGTAMNKRPEQLVGRLRQMAKAQIFPNLPIDINARYERRIPKVITANTSPVKNNTIHLREAVVSEREKYKQQAEETLDGTLPFLNDEVSFVDGNAVELDSDLVTKQPIHWRIKCFGFEHIKWVWLAYNDPHNVPKKALDTHQKWLLEWVDRHAIAREEGYLRRDWTPHAVSLRICNWCRYDAWLGEHLDEEYRQNIRWFIWKNTAFLSDNVEYGVGGNHLIENGIALLMSGIYLENNAWVKQGHMILKQAVDNQLLSDGGHFERCPMYHLIVCQRLLTATDLLKSIGKNREKIHDGAIRCVSFVEQLSPPDERIPLLNDSVFSEALSLSNCLAFAKSVLGEEGQIVQQGSASKPIMSETGYYWLGSGEDRLLAVAGDITVPHLPAHAHAHPAHICLWTGGSRVITDTGVYEYAAGERRQQSKSVRNHNTIQVDEGEPLRFSGEFLCWGNISPDVKYSVSGNRSELNVRYSADAVGQPDYHHERTIEHQAKSWRIRDQIEDIEQTAVSRLHIHPDCSAEMEKNQISIYNKTCEKLLYIESAGCDSVSISCSPYYPEYGRAYERDVVEFQRNTDGEIDLELSCCE